MRHALQLALDGGLSGAALRAYNNLMTFLDYQDQYAEALDLVPAALELARRTGDRPWEMLVLASSLVPLLLTGRWDELVERAAEIGQSTGTFETSIVAIVQAHRGDLDRARALLDSISAQAASPDLQTRSVYCCWLATVLRAEGDSRGALEAAETAIATAGTLPTAFIGVKLSLVEAIEAALDLDDDAKAEALLERMEHLRPGETTPFFVAQAARFRVRLASTRNGGGGADSRFNEATTGFRRMGATFWLAVTLLEHGEWLLAQKRAEEAAALFGEAREIFERLKARPWLERVARAASLENISA